MVMTTMAVPDVCSEHGQKSLRKTPAPDLPTGEALARRGRAREELF